MGRADLIGNGKHHLIPNYQPQTDGSYQSARRKNSSTASTVSSMSSAANPRAPARVTTKLVNNPRDFTLPENNISSKPARPGVKSQGRPGLASKTATPARSTSARTTAGRTNSPVRGQILTQHTGLPPRSTRPSKKIK
jgi:hypothetical protein